MKSEIRGLGPIEIPRNTAHRIMMMPFRLDDVAATVPGAWRECIADLVRRGPCAEGVGYLTVDDATVRAGETHRRPGLHVDGGSHDAPWAPSPGAWGGVEGMIVAATILGSRAWCQDFDGTPGVDGDCEHLRDQCRADTRWPLHGGEAYWLGATCVHESIRMPINVRRTFVRVSMPSAAPWFYGYTPSPFGVMPTGPILPPRIEQMNFRV